MDTADIERLLEPFAKLDQQQLSLTSTYIDLLLKWNARINLTSVRDPQEIVTRHFGESFFVARTLSARSFASTIDLGSGAGFPGLPLAILLPEVQVALIESNQKKSTFLREVAFALKLQNTSVFSGRGEDHTGRGAVVTMRAVEQFQKALPVALGLVEQDGRIALMIGASQVDEAVNLAPQVGWHIPIPIPSGHSRVLLVGAKTVKGGAR